MSSNPSTASHLEWLNSQSDGSGSRHDALSGSGRKRQSTVANGSGSQYTGPATSSLGRTLSARNTNTSSREFALTSPSKRHRSHNNDNRTLKTPTKSVRRGLSSGGPAAGSVRSGASGMRTPPPSSAGTIKMRGRPSHQSSVSRNTGQDITPPPTSPTNPSSSSKSYYGDENIGPMKFGRKQGSSSSNENSFWESQSAESTPDLNGSMPDHQNKFDWVFREKHISEDDPFALRHRSPSPHSAPNEADDRPFYSFSSNMGDFSNGVDPNLLQCSSSDSAESGADLVDNEKGFGFDAYSSMDRPYQHQYMQQQLEEEQRMSRRRSSTQRSSRTRVHRGQGLGLRHFASESNLANYGTAMAPLQIFRSGRGQRSPIKGVKTQVVFAISPSGRAKTEKVDVYCPADADDDRTVTDENGSSNSGWDSFDESDSSFDEDTPRGLAPDGGEYMSFRKRSTGIGDPFTDSGNFMSTSAMFRTPTKPYSRNRSNSAFAAQSSVAGTTSPIATPFRSSPPPHFNAVRQSSTALANINGVNISSQLVTPGMDDDGNDSEAETVIDEYQPYHSEPTEEPDNGDALAALKRIVTSTRRRNSEATISSSSLQKASDSFSGGSLLTGNRMIRPSKEALAVIDSSTVKKVLFAQKPQISQTTPSSSRRRNFADGGYGRGTLQTPSAVQSFASDSTELDPYMYPQGDGTSSPVHSEGSDGETRCVCGKTDKKGGMMVECDSCKKWLHLKCTGYSSKRLPQTFVCKFCTATPRPKVRTRSTGENCSFKVFKQASKSSRGR